MKLNANKQKTNKIKKFYKNIGNSFIKQMLNKFSFFYI